MAARLASDSLRDEIDDDVDSSEEFDDHHLSDHFKKSKDVLKNVESLILANLTIDVSGDLRAELEKKIMFDSLRGVQSPLKAILKKSK